MAGSQTLRLPHIWIKSTSQSRRGDTKEASFVSERATAQQLFRYPDTWWNCKNDKRCMRTARVDRYLLSSSIASRNGGLIADTIYSTEPITELLQRLLENRKCEPNREKCGMFQPYFSVVVGCSLLVQSFPSLILRGRVSAVSCDSSGIRDTNSAIRVHV